MEQHNTTYNNPRKRQRTTKFMIRTAAAAATTSEPVPNPRPAGKPDPCTECGRKFWSWKALFGHMRCHPERQWRGIVPPPNLRRRLPETTASDDDDSEEEDHEIASCLLMLANGPPLSTACTVNCGRFECSSCKKVFGSHQALGGHRASHKNVKGCYAIKKSFDGEEEYYEGCCSVDDHNSNGYKCSICFRVFTSGQALGGHMRCHWDSKVEGSTRVFDFDLNLAQDDGDDDDDASFGCSWAPGLNLELGL